MRYIRFCLTLICILSASTSLFAATATIISPRGGFTSQRVQEIKGRVDGFTGKRAILVLNGIPQTIPLQNGEFSINAVVAPGNNLVELIAGDARDRVSFFAKVPGRDVKVVLTWDTPTDVDLWVIDPTGEKCYYAARSTKSGGNLDVDVTTGYGPETFTMAKALPGNYSVQTQYYSSGSAPVTRVNVYLILYEGTPKEQRKQFQFVMTAPSQVYHITDFTIDPDE
ncbi:MAG TPA: DUF2135 domain-containing protein [Spirochaetota bacterium]